jgi:molybdenum cofactor synthesis domain-containing protein
MIKVTPRALVITVSTRTAKGEWEDRSGPVLVEGLTALGIAVDGPVVASDGEPVEAALRDGIKGGYELIITTGGTGLTPSDRTPEMTRRVIDREAPGIAEAIRAYGLANGVATAALSRAIAGLAGETLIVNAPGSPGGARDAVAVMAPWLVHALEQVHGSDHTRTE